MNITSFGVGNMGTAIARRLLAAGHEVTAFDRSTERVAALVADGAQGASSAQEAVARADLVITSLLGDGSVLDSVNGPNGFLAAMRPGAIHLCVTTISAACADRLSSIHGEAGTRFVSGPVAGRPDSAASGQLRTYLAGDASAIREIADVVPAYTRQSVAVGDCAGLANTMKLAINYTAISLIELMGEVYTFAEKAGLDRALVFDFFDGSFNSPAMKGYAKKLRDHETSGVNGFAMTTGLKDVKLMLDAADEVGVDFAIGQVVRRKLEKGIASGMGDDDWSAISQVTRAEAGLR